MNFKTNKMYRTKNETRQEEIINTTNLKGVDKFVHKSGFRIGENFSNKRDLCKEVNEVNLY